MASLFVIASLSALAILWCCNADLIDDICAQSTSLSPSACTETLRSDPRSRGADLRALGQISIEKAKAATQDVVTVARSFLNRNNSNAVDECRRICSSAIEDLTIISQIMAGQMDDQTKGDLPIQLSGAATLVGTCDDEYELFEAVPPQLKEASKIAIGRIVVVLIIGTML